MIGLNIFQFFIGMGLLYFGAEFLIKGSKLIAKIFKMSPVLVGITLVALGTSLPELIVSIIAIIKDEPGIVIGNIIGSNISNIGLVLGLTAVLKPIYYLYSKLFFDLYYLIFITLIPFIFIYFSDLYIWHGFVFISLLILYCWKLYKTNNIVDGTLDDKSVKSLTYICMKIILGIISLGTGAHFFVLGATEIAIKLGISSLVIGMSIVAIGTSLPELASSIIAAKHNQMGLVIGNIIGSNIMNILAVLGFTLIVKPIEIEFYHIYLQGVFLIFLTLLLFFVIKTNEKISRTSGGVFLIIYILFLYFNFQTDKYLGGL